MESAEALDILRSRIATPRGVNSLIGNRDVSLLGKIFLAEVDGQQVPCVIHRMNEDGGDGLTISLHINDANCEPGEWDGDLVKFHLAYYDTDRTATWDDPEKWITASRINENKIDMAMLERAIELTSGIPHAEGALNRDFMLKEPGQFPKAVGGSDFRLERTKDGWDLQFDSYPLAANRKYSLDDLVSPIQAGMDLRDLTAEQMAAVLAAGANAAEV